ncbi:MAG: aspartate/glutamate racemase family protein [Chitinophagaceae bacterium]|nr:aspartate/glutamate racemase family protein [Chitinophagaceae bacterium]
MKTIGLIGGTTWYSSLDYYRYINEIVNERLGGDEAAKMILYSINYGEIKRLTQKDDWKSIADIICNAARKTQNAGADCILLGANTMHNIADEVQNAITIPLIHIADETAKKIQKKDIKKIALIGTKYTMQLSFFKDRLTAYGISTLIPGAGEMEKINTAIYNELGKGILLPETKEYFLTINDQLKQQGAEGIILGCTEIPLLIKPDDCSLPLFDTTFIHANAAVDFAMAEE